MDSSERREMSVTQERGLSEETPGFDKGRKEGNDSKQSESVQNKCADQSDTLSSSFDELKKSASFKNVEQTTLLTSPQPLTSVLRSCQQACTIIAIQNWVIICVQTRRVINGVRY